MAGGVLLEDKMFIAHLHATDSVVASLAQPSLQRFGNVAQAFGDEWHCKANIEKSVAMLPGGGTAVERA